MAGVDEEAKSTQGSFNKRNIADDEYDFVEPIVNEENVENYTTDSEETVGIIKYCLRLMVNLTSNRFCASFLFTSLFATISILLNSLLDATEAD
ncbi:unnamed protein product, partial [Rotaria magnacalcarata]